MQKLLFSFLLALTCCLSFTSEVLAASIDPLYGAEMTFKLTGLPNEANWDDVRPIKMNDFVNSFNNDAISRKKKDLNYVIIDVNKFIYPNLNRYKFTYPNLNGFWFELGTDPDVIEVRAKPSTVEEYEKLESILQHDLFDRFKKLGVRPHVYEGGGHIHTSNRILQNALVLRNYVVDAVNNWELGAGVLGVNRSDGYGPSINYEKYDTNYNFSPDRGKFRNKSYEGTLTLRERVEAWRAAVSSVDAKINSGHITSTGVKQELFQGLGADRYTAINLKNDATVERRFYRPQKSMRDFVSLIRLDRARLRMIAKRKTFVPVRADFPMVTSVSPKKGAMAFKDYVMTTGEDYSAYQHLLPVRYQNALKSKRDGGRGAAMDETVERLPVITQVTSSSCSFAALSNAIQFWNDKLQLNQKEWLSSDALRKWKKRLGNGGNGITLEEFEVLTAEVLDELAIEDYEITSFRLPTQGREGIPPSSEVRQRVEDLLKEFDESDGLMQIVLEINPYVLWSRQDVKVLSDEVGHYVQVQKYDKKTNEVLLADPYPDYPRQYWLGLDSLLRAMNTHDDDIITKRKGFLIIDLPELSKNKNSCSKLF